MTRQIMKKKNFKFRTNGGHLQRDCYTKNSCQFELQGPEIEAVMVVQSVQKLCVVSVHQQKSLLLHLRPGMKQWRVLGSSSTLQHTPGKGKT